jgi:hypothetical protein
MSIVETENPYRITNSITFEDSRLAGRARRLRRLHRLTRIN